MTGTCAIFGDAALAAAVATVAGRLLLQFRDDGLLTGQALGRAGDALSQAVIGEALRTHRPDDAVLSEETADDAARLDRSRVWIVDPLDGTREYAEHRRDWTVHVALAIDGVPGPAAVAAPGLGRTYRSDAPPALIGAPCVPPRIVVSRTRPPAEAARVAARLGATLLPMGSAGAKALAVLRGDAEIYLHSGGQHEWDSCAPVAVALAAGLHVSRIDGSSCRYNRPDPYMPDLLICRRELAGRVLEALAESPTA